MMLFWEGVLRIFPFSSLLWPHAGGNAHLLGMDSPSTVFGNSLFFIREHMRQTQYYPVTFLACLRVKESHFQGETHQLVTCHSFILSSPHPGGDGTRP